MDGFPLERARRFCPDAKLLPSGVRIKRTRPPVIPISRARRFLTLGTAAAATLAAAAFAQPAAPPPKTPDFSGYWSHNISHYLPLESGPRPVEGFADNPHLYQQDLG